MTKRLQDYMTSELLFRAIKEKGKRFENDIWIFEYQRRLKKMGLSDEQIAKFRKKDEVVIQRGCYIEFNTLLATQSFIERGVKEQIKVENCTFSELAYLIEESNFAYLHHRYCLSEEAENLIRQNALYFGMCKSAIELRSRMKEIGISEKQEAIFLENECKIIKKVARHNLLIKAW